MGGLTAAWGLGLLTSFLTLLGALVTARMSGGTLDLMGLYVFLVLPVGPVCVGLFAGSGFGWGSWLSGHRTPKWEMIGIAAFSLCIFLGYYLLEYVLAPGVADESYWTFLDRRTREIHLSVGEGTARLNSPDLGAAGYLFRSFEFVAFSLGFVVVPLLVREKPYCVPCGMFKRTWVVGILTLGKPKARAQATILPAQIDAQRKRAEALLHQAEQGQLAELKEVLLPPLEGNPYPGRIEVRLRRCVRCRGAELDARQAIKEGSAEKAEILGLAELGPSEADALEAHAVYNRGRKLS